MNTVWFDPHFDLPKEDELVLCIKMDKKGNRSYSFGRWFAPDAVWPEGHWVTGGGNNNVIYWTHLPKMPGKGA